MIAPRFAVSMRVQSAVGYYEPRDALSHDWLTQIKTWGGSPVPVPNLESGVSFWLDDIAPIIVILTGGNDIILRSDVPDDRSSVRDATEIALVDWARERSVPIFATCRGLHVINQYFGGSVHDIAPRGSHVARDHEVQLCSPLSNLIGDAGETLVVNSYHNLGIAEDEIGRELSVCATSMDDGLVEAVVHESEPIVAVQWHPERRVQGRPGLDDSLFRRLLTENAFWKGSVE